MAVGAVVFSLPVALFGSLYVSVLNELVLWQGVVTYSALGFLSMLLIFTIACVETALRGEDTSGAQMRGPWN